MTAAASVFFVGQSRLHGRHEKILQSRADRSANHVRSTEGGKRRGLSAALLSHFRGMVHNFVLEDSVEEKLLSPFPRLSVAKKKDLSMRRRWVSALDAPPRCTKVPLSHLGRPPAHEAKGQKHRGEEQTRRECLSSTRRKIGRRVYFFFAFCTTKTCLLRRRQLF